jgi:hypothetical protein
MIRVAVLGNSHLAAVALGWQSATELHQELELTFFGAPAGKLYDLTVRDGCLYADSPETERHLARSSGGLTRVEVDAYDAFLLIGGFGFALAADICLSHRLPAYATEKHQLISEPALNAGIKAAMLSTLTPSLLRKLRSISDRPALIVTDPLPSSVITSVAQYSRRWTGDHLVDLQARYEEVLTELSDELDVPIYTQPPLTVDPPCFTAPEYAMDDPKHGITHTSSEFGAAVLREVAPRLVGAVVS